MPQLQQELTCLDRIYMRHLREHPRDEETLLSLKDAINAVEFKMKYR